MSRRAPELKGPADLAIMRQAGLIVWEVIQAMIAAVRPGATTAEIDRLAERETRRRGATPAFKGYRGFPASLCISVNEEVVHGIPSEQRSLREGDVVSLDFGVFVGGFYGDSAVTVPVGQVAPEAARLIDATRAAMHAGIGAARAGNRLHDIGHAVQRVAEGAGFSVVRDFVGHGIGRRLHEEPQVPNYGTEGTGVRLKPGMVLAIEPMVNAGLPEVEILDDGWTAITLDRRPSAHFEHTVAIGPEGPTILTLPDGVPPGREGLLGDP